MHWDERHAITAQLKWAQSALMVKMYFISINKRFSFHLNRKKLDAGVFSIFLGFSMNEMSRKRTKDKSDFGIYLNQFFVYLLKMVLFFFEPQWDLKRWDKLSIDIILWTVTYTHIRPNICVQQPQQKKRTKRCLLTRDAQCWIGSRFSFMPLNSILGKAIGPNGSSPKHQEKKD